MVWEKSEKVFISLNPGSNLLDLMVKERSDINKFSSIFGISGMVYKDGQCRIIDKPRGNPLFISEMDNLTPIKFLGIFYFIYFI